MICNGKHTKYDPTVEEFNCPKCGAPCGIFAIDEPATDVGDDCERLHVEDFLRCYQCDYGTSGRRFAAHIMKQKNLIPCPTCKGHGMISKAHD